MIDNQIILYKFIQINKNVNWYNISDKYILSDNFIQEFQDKVDLKYISIYKKLSENFIREFQDKIDWYFILKYQELSEYFNK